MASSGSYARGDQPRSVPDEDGPAYADMTQRQAALNQEQEAAAERERRTRMLGDRMFTETSPDVGLRVVPHPGPAESLIPVWGSAKEMSADLDDGNLVGAAVNGGLAALDIIGVGDLVTGGLKLTGPFAWRMKPGAGGKGMRQWMGETGFLKRGQPGHHWFLEQKTSAPDWLKNQPPFVTPTRDAVQHGRIHGPYTVNGQRLPQYNAFERFWFGTPRWLKAGLVSSAGHAGTAAGRAAAGSDN